MSARPKILGVIPARLGSTRLPGKVLREIAGKPMLYWVYHHSRRSPLLADLLVATENEEVKQFCETQGIPVTLTAQHPSPTDRVHEVMTRMDAEVYVNIQGDEPMLRPAHFELLLTPFLQLASIQTAASHLSSPMAESSKMVPTFTENLRRGWWVEHCQVWYLGS